jgi:hypothetical protein
MSISLPTRAPPLIIFARNPSIRAWAQKMLALAPKLEFFQASIQGFGYADVQVRYEHEDHDISCICSSFSNGNVTFSVPGPLIRL